LKIRQVTAAVIIALAVLADGCVRSKPGLQPDLGQIFRTAKEQKGKTPIIIIPGMLGSRLMNKATGEKVWPRAHPNEEDLKLPISPDLKMNRGDVVATEVVETVKLRFPIPEIKVYEELTDTLTEHAGYKRGNIDDPSPDGDHDTFYLFSYDWRRDNVESARSLSEKIIHLKQTLQRPDLQFNLVAHSMGGLIARYYLMYGGADMPDKAEPELTWAGAGNINKLILVGVPNEGTMDALRALVEGFPVSSGRGYSLPLLGKVEAETAFTMPAAFELLPHRGSQEFYDGRLQPVSVDLYEVETWRRYQWSIFAQSYRQAVMKKTKKMFGLDWQRHFDNFFAEREAYFKVVLFRARLFAEALDKKSDLARQLKVFIFAGDCERTLRAAVVIEERGQIRTVFRPHELDLKGTDLTQSMVEVKMFEPGDGRITRRSALAIGHDEPTGERTSFRQFPPFSVFGCEIHGDLPNNHTFQNNLLSIILD
jgi:pimeloyl-ACP methyl ester carboxylesterase